MSKASDILRKSNKSVFDTVKDNLIDESVAINARVVTGLTDTVARYRSTQKLEYRMNLIMTALLYTAASSVNDPSDKNRLISLAMSINREFGHLKEISDISSVVNSIYNKVR